ncbi:MAG: hypothetical protein CMJ84_15765 [Planctomycetes bacterium]|jgi:ATP-dependent DNA helicase RecQ|nr:hypothetical protein [Planctomycetota bacterium]MDP6410467.1 RecQ family ATP-dependent DNA helicase [Planctomycetota bacterium]
MAHDPTHTRLLTALRDHFGHRSFRGSQAAALRAVLAGRDVLLTMPTGAGESLVYQLPATLLEGLTVVVSPLIALMADQVDALVARGLRAAQVNSAIPAAERTHRLESAARGELDLLFITPERFRSPRFRALLDRLDVSRLAVDEAHCISHWGHDFRPDYHKLGEYRALLGDPPTVALTATAAPAVADDIIASLRLADPLVIREGIERPNLFLACTAVDREEQRLSLLSERIATIDGPGIVYSTLIRDLERLHDELRRLGVASLVYHGKLSSEEPLPEASRALVALAPWPGGAWSPSRTGPSERRPARRRARRASRRGPPTPEPDLSRPSVRQYSLAL